MPYTLHTFIWIRISLLCYPLPNKTTPTSTWYHPFSSDMILKSIPSRGTCTFCNRFFHRLRRHVEEVHFQLRPYWCEMCDRRFSREEYRERHLAHCPKRAKSWCSWYCGNIYMKLLLAELVLFYYLSVIYCKLLTNYYLVEIRKSKYNALFGQT